MLQERPRVEASVTMFQPNLKVGSYSYLQIMCFPLPRSTLPLLEPVACTISYCKPLYQ